MFSPPFVSVARHPPPPPPKKDILILTVGYRALLFTPLPHFRLFPLIEALASSLPGVTIIFGGVRFLWSRFCFGFKPPAPRFRAITLGEDDWAV